MSTKYLTHNKDIDYMNAINKLASPYNHNNYAYNDKIFPSKCQIYEFHPNKFIKKGGKTKKRKNLKNKSKKRKGGGNFDDLLIPYEKYLIDKDKLTDENYKKVFVEAFGDENGNEYFDNKAPYLLYKIPIEGDNDVRIKCAAKYAIEDKEKLNINDDTKLFNYRYINKKECDDHGGSYCEWELANNRYNRLLNKSNPMGRKQTYDDELKKCIANKNKTKPNISPRSVTQGYNEEKVNEINVFEKFNKLTMGGIKKKKRRRRTKKRKS